MCDNQIDWRLVNQVWQCIETNDEPQFAEKKNEILNKHHAMIERPPDKSQQSLSPDETSGLPPKQKTFDSLHEVVDLLAFVASACEFYDQIRSVRPLTDSEKQIGQDLSSLLQRAQALVLKIVS